MPYENPQPLEVQKHIEAALLAGEINNYLQTVDIPAVVLPKELGIHSIESYLDVPRHFKAVFQTSSIKEFINYSNDQVESNVFVASDRIQANAIFDIGTPDYPDNRNHKAELLI